MPPPDRVLHLESRKPLDRGAEARPHTPIQSATRTERSSGASRPASPAHGRKTHPSLGTNCRSPHSRRRRRSGAGSPQQSSRSTDPPLPRCRGIGRRSTGLRLVAGRRRGSLRVPARRRCRFQLARARHRLRRLHDSEHTRDRAEDDPQRNVLLACARDRGGRLSLGLDGRPVVP